MTTSATTSPPAPSRDGRWPVPSVVALVLANLPPLYGVLFLDWAVFPVVFLFWLENVIVGVLNVARMLVARPDDGASWIFKVIMIPFFVVHYGMFTLVHGMFVIALFGGRRVGANGFPTPAFVASLISEYHLWWAVLALAASHTFSFLANYLGRGEYRTVTLQALMSRPYGRVVVLHLAIIGGGFLLVSLGSPVAGVALLVALKIGLDIHAHAREHRPMRASPGITVPEAS